MIDIPLLKQSFGHALRGLRYAFSHHQNLRIHTLLAVLAVILGIVLRLSFFEWVVVLLAILLVFVTEMINTAFEEIINLLKCEYEKRCEIAKNVSAGMVLLAALFALVVGAVIFLPKIFH